MSLSNELRIKIYRLSEMGKGQRAIAKELGVSKTTVQRILANRGPVGAEKWLVLPDPHVPDHHQQAWENIRRYVEENGPWDGWICLGDLCDFKAISKYDEYRRDVDRCDAIGDQYVAANRWLDELQNSIGWETPGVLIEGNHDARIHKYAEQHPEVASMIQLPTNLDLEARNIQWVPHWSQGEVYTHGHATFIHGHSCTVHHAKKAVEDFATNIFTGHMHDLQMYSRVRLGDDDTIVGASLGCLQDYNPEYMRGKPNKWQLSFSVFYFWPNGHFNWYPTALFSDGVFVSPEGWTP